MRIKGILFDSGDTLIFPKTGSWWPGPDFEPILQRHGIYISQFSPRQMKTALDEGEKYLAANHSISDLEEEREQFRTYYRIVCSNLGIGEKDNQLFEDLAGAYVDGCNVDLYPDTVSTLNKLTKEGVILGILSDAWPSLNKKYEMLSIRKYFKSFTISSQVGCCKPNELIYQKAIHEIGINPENLLFVDDDYENAKAAVRLGMRGTVISRNGENVGIKDIPFIEDLNSVFKIIKGQNERTN